MFIFLALCSNKRGLEQIMPEIGETLSFKNHEKQYLSELTGFYGNIFTFQISFNYCKCFFIQI